MANENNSKPRPAPVVVVKNQRGVGISLFLLMPAILASVLFNGALMAVLYFIFQGMTTTATAMETVRDESMVNADPVDDKPNKDPFSTGDIDPAAQDPDTDIQYNVDRKAEVSVPGMVNPNEAVGIKGAKEAPPVNLPAPGGFGSKGQGGTIAGAIGNTDAVGMLGGYGPRGLPLAGTFFGRSGATREFALRDGGGTKETEAAVALGLQWIAKHQLSDGRWMLDDPRFKDKGNPNDIAATAFGLLPLLGAGKTHKAAKDNPYDKPIERALLYLIRKQDKRTGNFGGQMYAHGLATIAMCEAYGMTQDPNLRRPAQMAVNYIVQAQNDAGGWRYMPREVGDTSVTGWQVMALKSAQMAGLDVPEVTMRKAQRFIDSVCAESKDEGYTYLASGGGSSPAMSAVGLLCRQYLQSWGPQNIRMIKGVENHIKAQGFKAKDMYYSYYATQVMHHFGGQAWKDWNDKMRAVLVRDQDKSGTSMKGSWSSERTAAHNPAGGRMMATSLSLLTLEVYYRYLPLYYRESTERKVASQK
jgi:hypothetical protein